MPKFFDDLRHLPGKNKLNVYALLIAKLSCYPAETIQDKLMIRSLSKEIKVLFHNHEQQFSVLAFILQQHLNDNKDISENLKLFITAIINDVKHVDFKKYFELSTITEDDFECRVGRFFESNLAVNLLLNPSSKTWACVNKISQRIVDFILAVKEPEVFTRFLENLGPDSESEKIPNLALAFGRCPKKPIIDDVLLTLKEQKDFIRIMLIQFMFMRDVYPLFEFDSEAQERIRQFGYGGEIANYIQEIGTKDMGPFFWSYPKFIPYQDRGRGEFLSYTSTKLGISIRSEDRSKFPSATTTWCPDCLCQEANLESPYTKFLIKHDIPYVAGPSGMTTLLCSAMLFLGQFDNLEEHNYYILAIASFITGGGLHSLHEVLTIPQVRLGLLNAYKPYGDKAGNYQTFFELFSLDDKVTKNIDNAWDSTVSWFCKLYPELTTNASYKMKTQPIIQPDLVAETDETKKPCFCTLM